MSKHTPGPWFIWKERAMQEEGLDKDEIEYEMSEQNDFDVMAGTPNGKVTRGSIKGCRTVVTLDAYGFGDDEEEGRELALANARLIAAAPDLLEALCMVLDDPDALDGRPRTYECVRAAIAKATGDAT